MGVGRNVRLTSAHRSVNFWWVNMNSRLARCDGCRDLGYKRDKAIREWKELHNVELNDLFLWV